MPRSFLVKKKHRNGSGKVLPEVACEPPKVISFEPTSTSTRLDTIRVEEDSGGSGRDRGKSLESEDDEETEYIVVSSTSDDRGSEQKMASHPVGDCISRGRESGSVKSCTSEEYDEEEEEEDEEEEEEDKRSKAPSNECRYTQDTNERTVSPECLYRSFHVPFRHETDHILHAADASRVNFLLARSATSNSPLASIPHRETAILQNYPSDSWHRQEQFHPRDPCLVPKWSDLLLSRGVLPHPIALRTTVDANGGIFLPGGYSAWLETGATATPAPTTESRRQPFLSSANSDSNTPPLVPSDDTPLFPTPLLAPNYGAVTPNRVSSCSSPSPPPLASTPSHLYPHNHKQYNVSVRLQGGSFLPRLGFSVPEILWGREEPRRKPLVPADSTSILNDQERKYTNPFECATCRKTYSTFNGLAKHQRAVHCGGASSSTSKQQTVVPRRMECPQCERVYTTVGALKMHIRTHTLPCHCPVCGKAFSRPWLLQGHMRTHTGERPFECPHCARAFADRSNLRAHLQTHSDVKRYCCRGCGKTFSRMSLLMKHGDSICCST